MFQVQTHLGNITSTVGEFESKQKQRGELKDWILSQKATVTDCSLRPSKLRSDAAKQDIINMTDLLNLTSQKRQQLVAELTGPDDNNTEFDQLFDEIEGKITSTVVEKQGNQQMIEDYLQKIQDTNTWFDNVIKRADAVDKGSGMSCTQKQSVAAELQTEFNDQAPKRLDEVNNVASTILDFVNNLDGQQVEEQVSVLKMHRFFVIYFIFSSRQLIVERTT